MQDLAFWLQQQPAPASNPIIGFLPLIFIVAIFYFLVFMPMQRQKKQQASMLDQDTLIVRVKPDNIKLQIARSAVASLVNAEKALEQKK